MGRPKKLQYLVIEMFGDGKGPRREADTEEAAIAAAAKMKIPLVISGQSLNVHQLQVQQILIDLPAEPVSASQSAEDGDGSEDTGKGENGGEGAGDGAGDDDPRWAVRNKDDPNLWINGEGQFGPRESRLYYDSKSTAELIAERVGGVAIEFFPE